MVSRIQPTQQDFLAIAQYFARDVHVVEKLAHVSRRYGFIGCEVQVPSDTPYHFRAGWFDLALDRINFSTPQIPDRLHLDPFEVHQFPDFIYSIFGKSLLTYKRTTQQLGDDQPVGFSLMFVNPFVFDD